VPTVIWWDRKAITPSRRTVASTNGDPAGIAGRATVASTDELWLMSDVAGTIAARLSDAPVTIPAPPRSEEGLLAASRPFDNPSSWCAGPADNPSLEEPPCFSS
jgi:hypothetical protein